MLKAIVFDFDGLILDTETPEYNAWSAVYEAHGLTLPIDLWMSVVGRGSDQVKWTPYIGLAEQLGPIDRDVYKKEWQEKFDVLIRREEIRPGIAELIDAAQAGGIKLAVASSSGHGWVDDFLIRLGLFDKFDAIKCRNDVQRSKPAPDLYLAALEALGVDVSEAVALEDSPNGIAAAKAAGLYCIAIPNALTQNVDLSAADRIVDSAVDVTIGGLDAARR